MTFVGVFVVFDVVVDVVVVVPFLVTLSLSSSSRGLLRVFVFASCDRLAAAGDAEEERDEDADRAVVAVVAAVAVTLDVDGVEGVSTLFAALCGCCLRILAEPLIWMLRDRAGGSVASTESARGERGRRRGDLGGDFSAARSCD